MRSSGVLRHEGNHSSPHAQEGRGEWGGLSALYTLNIVIVIIFPADLKSSVNSLAHSESFGGSSTVFHIGSSRLSADLSHINLYKLSKPGLLIPEICLSVFGSHLYRTIHLIGLTLDMCIVKGPRRCCVKFGAIWPGDMFNIDKLCINKKLAFCSSSSTWDSSTHLHDSNDNWFYSSGLLLHWTCVCYNVTHTSLPAYQQETLYVWLDFGENIQYFSEVIETLTLL